MRVDVRVRIGERGHHLAHRLKPILGALLERTQHDLLEMRRHAGAHRRDRRRRLRQVMQQDLGIARAFNGMRPVNISYITMPSA